MQSATRKITHIEQHNENDKQQDHEQKRFSIFGLQIQFSKFKCRFRCPSHTKTHKLQCKSRVRCPKIGFRCPNIGVRHPNLGFRLPRPDVYRAYIYIANTVPAYTYKCEVQAYKFAIEMKQDFKGWSNKHQDMSPVQFNIKIKSSWNITLRFANAFNESLTIPSTTSDAAFLVPRFFQARL